MSHTHFDKYCLQTFRGFLIAVSNTSAYVLADQNTKDLKERFINRAVQWSATVHLGTESTG